MSIRLLKANEIDVRVQIVKEHGFSLLLYKDARVDMNILDETFGYENWKREHQLIGERLYCTVSVFNQNIGEWVSKQDVGTESYTEKEKGQASDSFKRACVNIGIGRELYTAPFIWITNNNDIKEYKGKLSVATNFIVSHIAYNEDREIVELSVSDTKGNERYRLGKAYSKPKEDKKPVVPVDKPKVETPITDPEPDPLICSNCGIAITQKVYDYSIDKKGAALCYVCQKK